MIAIETNQILNWIEKKCKAWNWQSYKCIAMHFFGSLRYFNLIFSLEKLKNFSKQIEDTKLFSRVVLNINKNKVSVRF